MTIIEDLCEHFREILFQLVSYSEPAITCSKLTIETPEQGVKYVQNFRVLGLVLQKFDRGATLCGDSYHMCFRSQLHLYLTKDTWRFSR